LVLACELKRRAELADPTVLFAKLSRAVADAHGILPMEIVVLEFGGLERTGKIRRDAYALSCRRLEWHKLALTGAPPARGAFLMPAAWITPCHAPPQHRDGFFDITRYADVMALQRHPDLGAWPLKLLSSIRVSGPRTS